MTIGMLSFIAGSLVRKKSIIIPDNLIKGTLLQIRSRFVVFIFFIIEGIGIVLRLLVLLFSVGTMSLENEALGDYRMSHQETPYDVALKFITPIITAITIYAISNFLTFKINRNKINISSILLIIGYFVFSMLSSARIEIIYLFIYFIV